MSIYVFLIVPTFIHVLNIFRLQQFKPISLCWRCVLLEVTTGIRVRVRMVRRYRY